MCLQKKAKHADLTEEFVHPRIDHYQTPGEVHISVFAKQADKERSTVVFEKERVHLDLYLHGGKRCVKALNLYSSIDPAMSRYEIKGTKVDIVLIKHQPRSWSLLEKSDVELPTAFGYTFTAGGRTGTVGGHNPVLDANNSAV